MSAFFSIFFSNIIFSQYVSPMKIEKSISGSFGELRPNHFHSGVDYRTFGRVGIPVYSVEQGYIARVKIQISGYGKAIYIVHPKTGKISVYAHLNNFNPRVEKIVKDMQYKRRSYSVDISFKENEMPVHKEELIGYSGNTGSSMGPHLHFEIRNYENSNPLNPMKNGFREKDEIPPILDAVHVIPIKNTYNFYDYFNYSKLELDKVNEVYGDFGIGIMAYDMINNSKSKNGVYSVCLKMDGDTIYYRRLDEFSFDETRYINNFIHYGEMIRTGNYMEKCFITESQRLGLYDFFRNNGIVRVKNEKELKFQLILEDEEGNRKMGNFSVKSKKKLYTPMIEYKDNLTFVKYNEDKSIKKDNFEVYIPKNSLYDNINLLIEESNDGIIIGYNEIPLHKKIKIKILDKTNDKQKNKYFISCKTKKNWNYNDTYYQDGYFVANVRELGEYRIKKDTIPPTIRIGKISPKSRYLNIYSQDKETGIKNFNAYINGNWILCEYDYKKNLFKYDFKDMELNSREINLKVVSEDYCSNVNTFEKVMKR